MNKALFSSKKIDWETPNNIFKYWDDIYHFNLDVCAFPHNTKCKKFFTPEINGLNQVWTPHICWMNPPYGRVIKDWVEKAYKATLGEAETVVCLLPARTDTAWWHEFVIPHASEIRFLRGRVKFSNAKAGAPFPSAIVVFKKFTQGEKDS